LETQAAVLATDAGEVRLNLTPIEFKLLNYLAKFEDRVFSRDQLIDAVWGRDISVTDRTVDKHVSLLRQKLDCCSFYIETVPGFGYKFSAVEQMRKTG
jgi:DNA-binding response OmpR family regulator